MAAVDSVTKVRVAIVGGGCAGLAAAWQLTSLNKARKLLKDDRDRNALPVYEITVYESTARLGGKGASLRDANGRILEHGLHVWLGFYENAFRMMRECFDELNDPDLPLAARRKPLLIRTFEQAFVAEPHIGVASKRRNGEWQVWSAFLPPMKGQPGDPLDEGTNPFTWWGYLARSLALAKALMQSVLAEPGDPTRTADTPGVGGRSSLDEAVELDFNFDPLDSPNVIVERMAKLLRISLLTSAASVLQGVTLLENWLRQRDPSPDSAATILKFVEALATQTRRQLQDVVLIDEELRRKTEIIDLLMTILLGLYRDHVFFDKRGLDAIEDIDYRDWLVKHGATHAAVDSPLVRGIYDLVFAYRDGKHEDPALSAGQALRGAMRMFFTYRGSMFWRLRAGMGDAVFAPLYRALRQRGVKFKFEHSLRRIGFDLGDCRVDKLEFDVPASTTADPLDAQGCWPERVHGPAVDAPAAGGKPLRLTHGDHTRTDHFDAVVLALGIDALFAVIDKHEDQEGFLKKMPRWEAMRKHVKTVGTRSAQVWLDRELSELGWDRGAIVVAGLEGEDTVESRRAPGEKGRSFETWADMTHTLASERAYRVAVAARTAGQSTAKISAQTSRDTTLAPSAASAMQAPTDAAVPADGPTGPDKVRTIAYFCGVVREPKPASRQGAALAAWKTAQHEEARSALEKLLASPPPYWPEAKKLADHLVSADGRNVGSSYLSEQHVQVNLSESERYTQSLPGSATYRISPLDPTFTNMTIAGDWTECGFNGGCVEAAVMSGMLAAHAISGRLKLSDIVGYDHP